MKPEPSPWRCGVLPSPRGLGRPKRRKNSSTWSSCALLRPLVRCAFSTTDTLTTAGPTCSTSVAKSGSVRPLSVPTGCGEEGDCAGAATGAGCVSDCGAAATEDWGEQAPTAKATIATPARRFATNSDISANPRCMVFWDDD